MKIKAWEAALCAALVISLLFGLGIGRQQAALENKLIRLHVVANSDGAEDQAVKLKVRDAVLDRIEVMLEGAADKDAAAEIIRENLDGVQKSAAAALSENGYDCPVAVTLEKEPFPTREYDTFSLPAGIYDSLRVTIGEGRGRNWWCVVFPPVCGAALTEEYAAEAGLTEAEFGLITEESGEYVVRFRLMEILGKLKAFFYK